jgi:hypothetical protein
MAKDPWKLKRDSLYRGDRRGGVTLPVPRANCSLVRHILYLEGHGRETPYLSSSESLATAARFAGGDGSVYIGRPEHWPTVGVEHRSRKELLLLLRGKGKGDAQWHSAFEVMRAHQFVEESEEHLADFAAAESYADLERMTKAAFTNY